MALHPDTKLETVIRIDEIHRASLKRLGILTVRDALYHFPARYTDITRIKQIRDLIPDETATIYGTLHKLKTEKGFHSKIPMAKATIEDLSGSISIVWFRQAYMAKMLRDGMTVQLTGRVKEDSRGLSIVNPEVEEKNVLPIDVSESLFAGDTTGVFGYPVYPETRGLSSKFFYHMIQKLIKLGALDSIPDPLPDDIRKKYKLPTLTTALHAIHAPRNARDAEAARKRLSFDEVFFIQLARAQDRAKTEGEKSYQIKVTDEVLERFTSRFPFPLTRGQTGAIDAIISDLQKPHPMARLLEGDVGSGKTAIAATISYATVMTRPVGGKDFGNVQVAYMAPTEILATQLFEQFITYFGHLPIQIGLITGSGCKKFPSKIKPTEATDISRPQLLKWVKNGEIAILIGTHALIQKSVDFKHLGLVIIDEQHRFGTKQRAELVRKFTRTGRELTPEPTTTPDQTESVLYKDLSYAIRRIIYEVVKELGTGHKESVYHKALEEAFREKKLKVSSEVQIPITYKTKKVGTYIPDFVIEDKIRLELKALPFLGDEPKKQLWRYLKNSPYRLGLLVNFATQGVEIQRVVYDTARNASLSHQSASNSRNIRDRSSLPHYLSMTATPIPRTLALTIYGDLDLSVLDEMPAGRKPIATKLIVPGKRDECYEEVRRELAAGRQAYVICPRIDPPSPEGFGGASEPDIATLQMKNVTEEAERLKREVFPDARIGILHSKMSKDKKDDMMEAFLTHEIDILVATSVVEVGVNVPNATCIIIEGAERFGLAQLHQLRGRVIRSNHQAYCYLFAEAKSKKTADRMKALVTAKSGFELAELDLALRGAGELGGGNTSGGLSARQWGISDIGMEAIRNIKMVEAARTAARELITQDETLPKYPDLAATLSSRKNDFHFE